MRRIKVITGYAALARFRRGIQEDSITVEIPRLPVATPYSSGPTSVVERWNGLPVVICETGQRRYEVYDVSDHVSLYGRIVLRRRADGKWGWFEGASGASCEVSGRTRGAAWDAARRAWPRDSWELVRQRADSAMLYARPVAQ